MTRQGKIVQPAHGDHTARDKHVKTKAEPVDTQLQPVDPLQQQEEGHVISPLTRCMTREEIEILSNNSTSPLERDLIEYLRMQQQQQQQHQQQQQQQQNHHHQQNCQQNGATPFQPITNQHQQQQRKSFGYGNSPNLTRSNSTPMKAYQTLSNASTAQNLSSPTDIANYMNGQNPMDASKLPHFPMPISQIKKENDFDQGYPSTDLGQSYTSDQASSQAMVSSFPYGAGGTGNESMYSQQSNLHTYMDSHGNASQNQMFQSYSAQGGHPGSMGLGVSPQAIGVAQQAQYLQPGQAASQRVPISHTTRASPITVQWLLENYETSDGVSLPRSTLYHHYLRHCAENKIDAVNAASFGKLIRSVFVGLKTRRLGTRGNSKYHYYGIRVKPNSPLARITDDTHVALRATPTSSKRSMGSNNYDEERRTEGAASNAEDSSALSAHQQYLGDVGDGLPEGPVIDLTEPLPEGLKKEDVITFGNYYRSHSEALLEVISTLQFDLVEALWQSFYKSPAAANKADNGTLDNNEFNITKNDLITFCNYKPVQVFIKETDYILYQKLVGVLVPDVLRAVPSALTQIVRNFAKSLENWLVGSMSEMPKEICNVKVAAVSAFSQTLRRYTSLNHLAQAARAVLQNSQQINQMWNDLNKVDFNNVQEQSSWVCQCDESLIAKLEQDFKQTLAQQHSLEQWAKWLESVVAMVLEPHQGQESYPKAARNFLLNWSFYSSMIIRDLTLRSAASFGSFHLIRLLYDEYMFYLIEHKVAAHTGKSPMSVMAECVGGMTSSSNGNQGNDDEDELDENSNDGLSALTGGDVLKAGANLTMSQINEGMEPVAKKLKPDHLG